MSVGDFATMDAVRSIRFFGLEVPMSLIQIPLPELPMSR